MPLLQPEPTNPSLFMPWHVVTLGDDEDFEISIWNEGDDMWGSESWGWANPYKIIVSELDCHTGIELSKNQALQITEKICSLFNKHKITPNQSTGYFWKYLMNQ